MTTYHSLASKRVIQTLCNGGVGVIPTDTLYGIVGSALSKKTVERIYTVRHRDSDKPLIVLIGSIDDVSLFGIHLHSFEQKIVSTVWPGKVSVVIPCAQKKFTYLHRGTKSIAFRMPRHQGLLRLLVRTGPLVAPSANTQGHDPAYTIAEAHAYFRENVDFYVDVGERHSPPSTLISLDTSGVRVVREGAVPLSDKRLQLLKILK